MIGFGFMDNIIMIQAGDYIDATLGVTLGFPTIVAAALGNVCSDSSGVVFGGIVESASARLNLAQPLLTAAQARMAITRRAAMLGQLVGVVFGCFLGMTNLCFMDLEKSERLKKQRELRTLYATLMQEGHELIGAQHVSLFLLDQDAAKASGAADDAPFYLTSMGWKGKEPTTEELRKTFDVYDSDKSGFVTSMQLYHALRASGWTAELSDIEALIAKVDTDKDNALSFAEFSTLMRTVLLQDEVRLKVRRGGSRDRVLRSGELLNVRDVERDPRIDDESRLRYKLRGYDVHSLLLAPVFDAETKQVIGLVELVNKEVTDDLTPEQQQQQQAAAPPSQAQRQRRRALQRRNSEFGFSRDDERLLTMLCSHTSIFLRHLETGSE